MRILAGVPGIFRVAAPIVLGLSLLVAGCAATRIPTVTGTQAKNWEWCDSVQQDRPTLLCFQR